jgi:hypothetical protein
MSKPMPRPAAVVVVAAVEKTGFENLIDEFFVIPGYDRLWLKPLARCCFSSDCVEIKRTTVVSHGKYDIVTNLAEAQRQAATVMLAGFAPVFGWSRTRARRRYGRAEPPISRRI